MLSPWECYQKDLEREDFQPDSSQAEAIKALDQLYHELIEVNALNKEGWIGLLKQRFRGLKQAPKGLYFWGGVGRGKTYMMDLFYNALPFKNKKRLHFHHFMKLVHERLKYFRGQSNPLSLVAKEIADDACVLCFDEFFVSDIGDAMILANLLDSLFESKVALVATSNVEPSQLYKDGLQRKLFLPAIDLISRSVRVINVDGGQDYRLRTLTQIELFHAPLDDASEASLMNSFHRLSANQQNIQSQVSLVISGRTLIAELVSDDVALFDFKALCDTPRSANDYIELAQQFYAICIRGVPIFTMKNDDAARRFINLIDEFYDSQVKLVLTAEMHFEQLYQQGNLAFEFQRTVSRLQEMQTEEYLKKAHRTLKK